MAAFLITDEEFTALEGLPYGIRVLYLMLRRHMDFGTGLVGARTGRGISWQALAEWMYVEPQKGFSVETCSKEKVRRMARQLEKTGLVEARSNPERLIFRLNLAVVDTCVQKKADTKPTRSRQGYPDREADMKGDSQADSQADTLKASNGGVMADKADREADTVADRQADREADTKPTGGQPAKADTPPVSGIPETLSPFGGEAASGEAPPAAGGAIDKSALAEACRQTWKDYALAYQARYGTGPVRNARVNAMIRQYVQRVGQEEAPALAAWFVAHNGAWYVRQGHQVSALLQDAEKLRTEWVTGKRMTSTRARQMDQTEANISAVGEAIGILRKARSGHA